MSEELPLLQQPALRARCGAVWGGRGPERPEPSGKEAAERNETPRPRHTPNPQPLSSETDALSLGLLSPTPRR